MLFYTSVLLEKWDIIHEGGISVRACWNYGCIAILVVFTGKVVTRSGLINYSTAFNLPLECSWPEAKVEVISHYRMSLKKVKSRNNLK